MTLGQRIQDLRKQKGMSQETLGEALGVSRQAVSKWEGDNGIPELDTLIAMSRLFGITMGGLLGIEEEIPTPAESDRETSHLEAVLRRYEEECRAEASPPARRVREKWIVAAALVMIAVMAVLFAQIHSLRSTVRQLRSQMGSLEVRVSNDLSGLSGQIRNSIYDVLAEQSEVLSTFDWTLEDADLKQQTATVRLDATMKEYRAGSKVQFLLDWTKVDKTEGRTIGDWVEGPDFTDRITLPMNYRTAVTIRVMDAEGNVQEQKVDTAYDLHPDNFHMSAYNLAGPFAVTVKGRMNSSVTAKGENPHVDLISPYPQVFWPEKAVITAAINGETVFSEQMCIADQSDEHGCFDATIKDGYFDITLQANDELEIQLDVTDNLGRQQQFTYGGKAVYQRDGNLELELVPMAAPAVVYN